MIAILSVTVLGLAFTAWLGGITGRRFGRELHTLANTAPSYSTTPYDPNSHTYEGGRISKVADAAITQRWSLVTFGATTASVKANTASSTPIGVVDDTTDTLNSDLTIPVVVNLFGGTDRTLKVAINSTVTQGDWLIPDTSNPIYGMTDPGLNFNRFGRALQSGVAGGVVDVEPMSSPSKFASGIAAAAASSTSDTITVPGLLSTDFVVVTLNTIAGSELYVKTAVAAAGQINITLNAAATSGSTKYNWAAYRA